MEVKMRKISFRAWDKIDEMLYGVEKGITFDDGSRYEFTDFLHPEHDDCHEWILMQFTGLKDKNREEIYRGDILEVDGLIGSVVFKDSNWRIKIISIDKKKWSILGKGAESVSFKDLKIEDWKIIGNIYENKDLIKGM